MKAAILRRTGDASKSVLTMEEAAQAPLEPNQVRLRMRACGVCRTDLHIVEGDLPALRDPLIPGHQIVGDSRRGWHPGAAVGLPRWRFMDGRC